MNKPRPKSYNSSNLFHGVSRKSGGLVINLQRFKNYYEKMSNVVGLTIAKSISHKENQQPQIEKQQDNLTVNQNRHFKIRSLKVKNLTTSVQAPISTKRLKTFTIQFKHHKNSQEITKMVQKIELKRYNAKNNASLGIIIDAQLFLNPRSFWNKKSSSCAKRTITKNFRIKTDVLDSFLSHVGRLENKSEIQIFFRVNSQQQTHELQAHLKSNKQISYSIFYIKKKQTDQIAFYCLQDFGKIPENIMIIEQKNKSTLALPFFSQKQQVGNGKRVLYLLVDSLIKYTDSHIIESLDLQNGRVNVNANLIFEQNLHKYNITEKIKIAQVSRNTRRQSRKSSRYRCNSEVISYCQNVPISINYSHQKMEDFKQKMVKYIKILIEERKLKQVSQIPNINDYSNLGLLDLQSLDRSSKTPNQVIAQLTKLNSYNAKQIHNFQNHSKNITNITQLRAKSNIEYQIPIFRLS